MLYSVCYKVARFDTKLHDVVFGLFKVAQVFCSFCESLCDSWQTNKITKVCHVKLRHKVEQKFTTTWYTGLLANPVFQVVVVLRPSWAWSTRRASMFFFQKIWISWNREKLGVSLYFSAPWGRNIRVSCDGENCSESRLCQRMSSWCSCAVQRASVWCQKKLLV